MARPGAEQGGEEERAGLLENGGPSEPSSATSGGEVSTSDEELATPSHSRGKDRGCTRRLVPCACLALPAALASVLFFSIGVGSSDLAAALCNASAASGAEGQFSRPRAFHDIPEEWRQRCEAPEMRPGNEFNWPGRNWCWARAKQNGCYARGALPNWWWAQEWAWKADKKRMPHPDQWWMQGLVNPMLCDVPELGRPAEGVTPQELAAAHVWLEGNLAIYVVNLPSSVQRWEAMKQRLTQLGIDHLAERIDGVDMRKKGALEKAKADGFIPSDFDYDAAWAEGERLVQNSEYNFGRALLADWIGIGTVGCAAAHSFAQLEAERRASAAGKPMALVTEDDVWFQDDFVVKLYRLMTTETPCDWEVVGLFSRCPYGTCVSPHLARVQPDGNEPEENCHGEVQYGMYGMLYRTDRLRRINEKLQRMIWNPKRPGCMPPDVGMSAISDQIAYYTVPGTQTPGLMVEAASSSNRLHMNR